MSNTNTSRSKQLIQFLAIDKMVESNIILPTEVKMRSKEGVIGWGDRNNYPDYLMDLYNNVTTLKSIITGYVNYIKGDSIDFRGEVDREMNHKGQTITDIVDDCAFNYMLFGGFALQVIRSVDMQSITDIYCLDMRYIRTNEEGDVFFYNEEWSKGYVQDKNTRVYPKFMPGATAPDHKASVLYVKTTKTQVYPSPDFAAAVKACEIERSIDEYHLNSIANGFSGSYMVNFNNGIPSEETAKEVEDNFNRKFTGKENAGRVIFNWADGKDNSATVEKLDIEDFGAKYESLAKHSRQQIFTAFRANPNLFGIPTDNLGFSQEEYESAFKLFNRTQVKPIQKLIIDAFDKIYGGKGVVNIKPFSIEGDVEQEVQ